MFYCLANCVLTVSCQIHEYVIVIYYAAIKWWTRWKVLWESTSTTPRESEIWGFCCQHLATLATPTVRSMKCKQSTVYGVFDRYFRIPLPIVTKHELGLPFPSRNLPIKFGTNPSTIFLVIVVTDRQTHSYRQTHKPTAVKTYPLAFAGRMKVFEDQGSVFWTVCNRCGVWMKGVSVVGVGATRARPVRDAGLPHPLYPHVLRHVAAWQRGRRRHQQGLIRRLSAHVS